MRTSTTPTLPEVFRLRVGEEIADPVVGYKTRVVTDLRVSLKDFIALTGHSGVGKSVFLRGLLAKAQRMYGATAPNRPLKVAYVAQDSLHFPDFSLRMNSWLRGGWGGFARALELLPLSMATHIRECRRFSAREVSGGQSRALAIAATVVARPDVLILDETLTSMDADLLQHMIAILTGSLSRGEVGALMLSTHDERLLKWRTSTWRVTDQNGEHLVETLADAPSEPRGMTWSNRAHSFESAPPANARAPRSTLLLAQLFAATLLACLVTMGVLGLCGAATPGGRDHFVPSPRGLGDSVRRLLGHGKLWQDILVAYCLAILSVAIAVVTSFGIASVLLFLGNRIARFAILLLIALQSIPTLVVAAALRVHLGISTESIVILISTAFMMFPLSVVWTRLLSAAPHGLIYMRGRPSWLARILLSSAWAIGPLVRVVVASSPLAAIGVVVGGYMAGDSGLGYRMLNALTNSAPIGDRWVYTIACVLLGCLTMVSTAMASRVVLAQDADCV